MPHIARCFYWSLQHIRFSRSRIEMILSGLSLLESDNPQLRPLLWCEVSVPGAEARKTRAPYDGLFESNEGGCDGPSSRTILGWAARAGPTAYSALRAGRNPRELGSGSVEKGRRAGREGRRSRSLARYAVTNTDDQFSCTTCALLLLACEPEIEPIDSR